MLLKMYMGSHVVDQGMWNLWRVQAKAAVDLYVGVTCGSCFSAVVDQVTKTLWSFV